MSGLCRRPLLFLFCCLLFSANASAQFPGSGFNVPGGILIDAEGVIRQAQPLRKSTAPKKSGAPVVRDGHVCVSLKRLSEALNGIEEGVEIPPELRILGGLVQIDEVLLDREQGDVFLIGPAETAARDGQAFGFGMETGRPLMQTGDFLMLLNRDHQEPVCCSIDPEPDRLRRYNERVQSSAGRMTLAAAPAWFQDLAQTMGRQVVRLDGIPTDSRVGNVLTAADYRMKQIALGTEASGVREIRGQLGYASGDKGATFQRWWFATDYAPLGVNRDRTVFEISGPRLRLLAQEELIGRDGQRFAGAGNRQSLDMFARRFTEHFEELIRVRPVFADLKSVVDLIIVTSLLEKEGLLEQTRIQFPEDSELAYRLSGRWPTPQFVESGANLRRVNKTTIIGMVGGVDVRPRQVLRNEQPIQKEHDRRQSLLSPAEGSRFWMELPSSDEQPSEKSGSK